MSIFSLTLSTIASNAAISSLYFCWNPSISSNLTNFPELTKSFKVLTAFLRFASSPTHSLGNCAWFLCLMFKQLNRWAKPRGPPIGLVASAKAFVKVFKVFKKMTPSLLAMASWLLAAILDFAGLAVVMAYSDTRTTLERALRKQKLTFHFHPIDQPCNVNTELFPQTRHTLSTQSLIAVRFLKVWY